VNSSDSSESPHLPRIDAYIARTATESQRGQDASDMATGATKTLKLTDLSRAVVMRGDAFSGGRTRLRKLQPPLTKPRMEGMRTGA
jgi:hypothetical protein